MATKLLLDCYHLKPLMTLQTPHSTLLRHRVTTAGFTLHSSWGTFQRKAKARRPMVAYSSMQPLDLTEENIEKVLADARVELAQLFDESVGITGQAELAELDGPFVKIRLRGRFWHMRSTVLARLDNYLKQRIPEILEVDIEDEKQLDDSPANF